jgi:hypothetical protein
VLVALLPPEWVVHPERGEAGAAALGLEAFDPTRVPKAVQQVIPEQVVVVDLTPAMREASVSRTLFYRYDGHWTEAGHAVVAGALTDPVEALLARPSTSP